jgi:hypothetical protein
VAPLGETCAIRDGSPRQCAVEDDRLDAVVWLVLVAVIAILCSACAGRQHTSSSTTSSAANRNRQLATLQRLLPSKLGPTKLRKEAFTGEAWLKASPEEAFSPEVSIDASRFLERLEKRASDLTVAWAIAENGVGPKVVAYRVTGATAEALVDAYVAAIRERLSPGKLSVAKRSLWGKNITVSSRGLPSSRGYIYANHDLLFTAWTDHITPRELADLIPQLP